MYIYIYNIYTDLNKTYAIFYPGENDLDNNTPKINIIFLQEIVGACYFFIQFLLRSLRSFIYSKKESRLHLSCV